MTICIATDAFYPQIGGIATFYGNLTELLLQQGHRIIILTLSHDEQQALEEDEIIEERAYTKVVLKQSFYKQYYHYRKYFRPGGYMAPYWLAIGASMRQWLLQNHKAFDIDVVEVTDYGGIGFFLCDEQLPPVAVTGHGCLAQYASYNFTGNGEQVRLIQKLERLSFQYADSIIAHSPLNRQDLQQLSRREVLFATAPWIVKDQQPAAAAKKNGFLVVGGMQVVKGAITMAEAMEVCARAEPEMKLYWIGTDFFVAPGQQRMSHYLQKKHPRTWGKNFIWLDEQDRGETQKMLSGSMAVVVPSDWETFNYVALEAASSARPLVITDKAGAVYLFAHGKDALIVPAKDPQALADALLRLSSDPALRDELGRNSQVLINKVFNPETIVRGRLQAYEKTISTRTKYTDGFEQRSRFLERYMTLPRRIYYKSRSIAKKIIKGT